MWCSRVTRETSPRVTIDRITIRMFSAARMLHVVAKTITIGYCVPDTDRETSGDGTLLETGPLSARRRYASLLLLSFALRRDTYTWVSHAYVGRLCISPAHAYVRILANDDVTSDNTRVRSRFVRTDYAARVVAIINFFSLHYPRRRT